MSECQNRTVPLRAVCDCISHFSRSELFPQPGHGYDNSLPTHPNLHTETIIDPPCTRTLLIAHPQPGHGYGYSLHQLTCEERMDGSPIFLTMVDGSLTDVPREARQGLELISTFEDM